MQSVRSQVGEAQEDGGYIFTLFAPVNGCDTADDWDVSTQSGVKLGRIRTDSHSGMVAVLGFYGPKQEEPESRQYYERIKAVKTSDRVDAAWTLYITHLAVLRTLYPSPKAASLHYRDKVTSLHPEESLLVRSHQAPPHRND